jgi:nicotinate phosphoribosyltransferase
MIFDETSLHSENVTIIDPTDFTRRKKMSGKTPHKDLLEPIFQEGKKVYQVPNIGQIREYAQTQLASLHPSIKRLLNPHQYPVGLESNLHKLKTQLILQARGQEELKV